MKPPRVRSKRELQPELWWALPDEVRKYWCCRHPEEKIVILMLEIMQREYTQLERLIYGIEL